jgi:ABC-type antimicrobial peptide transport system permease subunit
MLGCGQRINMHMLKNYFTTAIRNVVHQKGSALVNIAGLTLGITCSLLLFLLVKHILSVDNYHSKKDRIYRVVSQTEGNKGKRHSSGVPPVLPDAFRSDFPEAEEVVFTTYRSQTMVTIPQPSPLEPKKYMEEAGIVYTEPAFFKIFDRPMLIGEAEGALDDPAEAIISRRWALKYFGKEDVRNEVLKFDTVEYKITAVMEDFPSNTDFPFDLMLSYVTIKRENEKVGWHSVWSDEHCYFLLREEQDIAGVSNRLPAFGKKFLGDNVNKTEYLIQPLSEIHFDDRFDTYTYRTTSRGMLISFQVIALILVFTACINFINLATAEAVKRSKEVGIRKALGSSRSQLITQFLGETALITIISVLISLGVTQLALTYLNPFLELNLSLNFSTDTFLWIFLLSITVLVSILAGLYPAFVVSGYNPVLALKNLISNKNSSGYSLRRALVVTQFVISQFFIIGTIVVINQMDYFSNKDLGFKKDAMLVLPIPVSEIPAEGKNVSKMRTLREELLKMPGVMGASLSSAPPSSGHVSNTSFTIEGNDQTFVSQIKQVDGNYIDLYDLHIIAGKNLDDFDTAKGFVVNEKFVQTTGLKADEIVDKVVDMWGKKLPVVGVVKDFHTVSLKQPIEATALMNRIRGYETLSVNVRVNRIQEVIDLIKPKWEAAYPEHIFDYAFLDQQIAEFYEGEKKMSVMLSVFSSIAIFIGCLGLYGLATFMANQKTKEVGVRKVLGASVESILMLFSKEYLKLICLGFLFSAPLAWFAMNKFLEEFTYKDEIGPSIFLVALGVTISIALLTVGYKSIKSAIANPVNSLRSE